MSELFNEIKEKDDIVADNLREDFENNLHESAEEHTDCFDEDVTNENTVTYKCPNCGAGLVYDAQKQSFVCKFCISEFNESDIESFDTEQNAKESEEDSKFNESVTQYSCPSCGAEIIVEKNTAADFCYYCHNPVVMSDKVTGNFKPSKIIPFKFDKAEAKRRFLDFAKTKWFCPNDYFTEAHSEKISGVYYPFWVTDADAHTRLDTTAFRVRTWTSGDYHYTETSKYDVKRGGNIHFEDITSSALSDGDKKMLEGILPYPSDEHIDFSMPYLQGFCAKKRDLDRDMLTTEVRERMKGYSESLLKDTINGYSKVLTDSLDLHINSSHWEYTLMPIWILTYKKGEKTFVYAMNGSTGKIYGELPVSPWKLALLGTLVTAAVAVISFLIGGQFL